jgi:hypothetical protein
LAYTKQNFINGMVLNADNLNKLENGVIDLESMLGGLQATVNSLRELIEQGGTGGGSGNDCGIQFVASTDTSNLLNLRDFESGTYVLSGKFHPYAGSTATVTFASALLVNIITKTAGTHVQVFYPVNNCVQFLEITDDSYERTNVYLNDLLAAVGTLSNLATTDKTSLVAAINEVFNSGGTQGEPGEKGDTGVGIATISQTTTSTADGGTNVITATLTNGDKATFNVRNGSKGSTGATGATGAAGKTPVKGTDYWTSSDIAEIKSYVDDAILGGSW